MFCIPQIQFRSIYAERIDINEPKSTVLRHFCQVLVRVSLTGFNSSSCKGKKKKKEQKFSVSTYNRLASANTAYGMYHMRATKP